MHRRKSKRIARLGSLVQVLNSYIMVWIGRTVGVVLKKVYEKNVVEVTSLIKGDVLEAEN